MMNGTSFVSFSTAFLHYFSTYESSSSSVSPSLSGSTFKPFEVYWNVPTFMCHKYGINFVEVSRDYKIIQNTDDTFRGDSVAILYDPGMFPALLKSSNGSIQVRNGGVPHTGNLARHLKAFVKDLDKHIAPKFTGLAIIDFESWRPIYRQHWGTLAIYRSKSEEIQRKVRPVKSSRELTAEITKKYEVAGRLFMEETLKLAKKLRPHAVWGYYAYPYCFNNKPNSTCSEQTKFENDRMSWLWRNTDTLMPSVYLYNAHSSLDREKMVIRRTKEAVRIRNKYNTAAKILPYWWFKYHDESQMLLTECPARDVGNKTVIFFLHLRDFSTRCVIINTHHASQRYFKDLHMMPKDVVKSLNAMFASGADGFVIWASSNDVNTKTKCVELHKYLIKVLGPAIVAARKTIFQHNSTL